MTRVLCLNPGSTSTKLACFDDDVEVCSATVEHDAAEFAGLGRVLDQAEPRLAAIMDAFAAAGVSTDGVDAVVARGGLTRPIPGGTYAVSQALLDDLTSGVRGEHASNLGAVLADRIARSCGAAAFIVDPVTVDELEPVARLSGHPEIERLSIFHALNSKAVARRYARDTHRSYAEVNLVVAHLGGGISVGAHRQGWVVDVNNALNGDGPFAPERAGGLPSASWAEHCLTISAADASALMAGRGGLASLVGTSDVRAVNRRAQAGDADARLALDALAYQVAKEIGACAAVLRGDVDAILLTGGIAHDPGIVDAITERVRFIAPVVVYPGEDELSALAEGALRVLRGEEEAKTYE